MVLRGRRSVSGTCAPALTGPRTNGKAERFIRTMLAGSAYGAIYTTRADRRPPPQLDRLLQSPPATQPPQPQQPEHMAHRADQPAWVLPLALR
jgi:hypothetical protein